ncbi:MAG TPA: MBL fold metallo-hydrolase [Rhodothermales bacterium]|nr:MBL fold metallo-hydrolase [Rhodothermales bacterium]
MLPARRPALQTVTDDVVAYRTGIVNVFLVGPPGAGDREWVLVDAGMPGYADEIAEVAAKRFQAGARPVAIVLTHGHFDHVGSLQELAKRWEVRIFAHPLEIPYLTGYRAYPPPDPTVGGGLMALSSPLFPRGPFDFGDWVHELPTNGNVPGMPGWRWIHTPGHTEGHVSLWREADRALLAGDAFVTTQQESAYAAFTQKPEVHGPPMYYTPDWVAAHESVKRLSMLNPNVAGTGHGIPYHGAALREALNLLARDFMEVAVPKRGRYVPYGLRPERPRTPTWKWGVAAGAVAGIAAGVAWRMRRER